MSKSSFVLDDRRSLGGSRKYAIRSGFAIANLAAFFLLFAFRDLRRQDGETGVGLVVYKTAKNAAVLALLNLAFVGLALIRIRLSAASAFQREAYHVHAVAALGFAVSALLHTIAHCVNWAIYYDGSVRTVEYLRGFGHFYVSGTALLLSVAMFLASKRYLRDDYRTFYRLHAIATSILIPTSLAHSYKFSLCFAAPLLAVVVPRVWSRFALRADVEVIRLAKTFCLVRLRVRSDELSEKFLLSRLLARNGGDCAIWLVCPAISRYESHPFTVILAEKNLGIVNVDLLISRFGKWKSSFYAMCSDRVTNSISLSVSIDGVCCHDSDESRFEAEWHVLKGVGLSTFLSRARRLLAGSPTKRRLLYLTYYTDGDSEYLDVLDEYVGYEGMNGLVAVHWHMDLVDPSRDGRTCCGTKVAHGSRLNHRRTMDLFLAAARTRGVVVGRAARVVTNDETVRATVARAIRERNRASEANKILYM